MAASLTLTAGGEALPGPLPPSDPGPWDYLFKVLEFAEAQPYPTDVLLVSSGLKLCAIRRGKGRSRWRIQALLSWRQLRDARFDVVLHTLKRMMESLARQGMESSSNA
jgi:hypothetical protein